MVVITQARQLHLPPPPPSSTIPSVIFDPTSSSLALMHSDSSFSLYPSLSPFSSPHFLPSSAAVVSPPSSSATFLRLQSADMSRIIFLVSSPHLAGTSVLLRFYILRTNNQFARARVVCNQRDLSFDEAKLGVLFRVNHGVSIKLAGSINVFAMYSVSGRKIWVFAVKLVGEGDDVKLMKSAVIDCDFPVFSISVSLRFLMLGEENGVRVFPLRPLVKGRIRKERRREVNKNSDKLEVQKTNLPNGMIQGVNGSSTYYGNSGKASVNSSKCMNINGNVEERMGKHSDSTGKLKTVKMRQDSKESGACFVAFKSKEFENHNSLKAPLPSLKAISIQVFAQNKFLILDSVGELYLLSMSNRVSGSELPCQLKKMTLTMKVSNLAVLPDDSARAQTVWISDGHHTVYTMMVSDTDSAGDGSDTVDGEEMVQNSAIQVIFTSEKIQEIIPLSANAILLLGQANGIFTYAIS